jgi:tetratricopeptide (TPR) repeat protein
MVLLAPAALLLVQPAALDAPAWMERGRQALEKRAYAAAADAFAKACESAPSNRDACYYFGRTLQSLDRYEEARRAFEQSLAHAAKLDTARVHRALALTYVGLVDPAKAEPHFRAAIRAYTGDGDDPRVDYGAFLVRQSRAAEAVPILTKAVKEKPDSARAYAALGRAQLETSLPADAAASLEAALALDGAAWQVRLLLVRAYQLLGRSQDAQRELATARAAMAR